MIEIAKAYIQGFFKNESSGHDYYHSLRVYETAMTIWEKEGGDQELIALAALLHDVDDVKITGGGTSNARHFLKENHISEEKIEKIETIISEVSFKGSDTKTPSSLEGMIVQDADRLDAIGAIGIARAFAYGGSHQRALYDPNEVHQAELNEQEYRSAQSSTIAHFYDKLLRLKDLMNTEYAKKMAIQRHHFMEDFLKEFYLEWEGKN